MLRFPKLFDLRADPFEAKHLATYQEFPPRQKPGSFSLDQVLAKLSEHGGGAK